MVKEERLEICINFCFFLSGYKSCIKGFVLFYFKVWIYKGKIMKRGDNSNKILEVESKWRSDRLGDLWKFKLRLVMGKVKK